jgi:hypothetical protein
MTEGYRTTRPCTVHVHVDMDDERFGKLIHYLGEIVHLDFEVEEEDTSIVEEHEELPDKLTWKDR